MSALDTDVSDVCVIGGGLAGLSAALCASDAGCRVTVLEQGEAEHYPCNSRYAGGMFHLAFLDMTLPAAEFARRLRDKCPSDLNRDLVAAIGVRARETILWLVKRVGARFIHAGPEPWQKYCIAPPRPMRSGLVWSGRGPDVLLRHLTAALRVAGGQLCRGATVTTLTPLSDGTYRVGYRSALSEHDLKARAVIVADGGFHADPDKLAAFVAPEPSRVLQRNAGTAVGLGLELARSLGARLSRLDRFYGHLQSVDALRNPRLWPYPTVDDLAAAGITVGADARRFFDEGKGGVFAANAVAGSKEPQAYVIFDQTVWESVGRNTRIVPCNPFLEEAGGTLHRADTVERVAEVSGLNPIALAQTVKQFNAAEFSVARSGGKFGHRPIVTPPFFCLPVCAAITYTMGGLCVTTDAAVISEAGRPIPGLYAAGSTVGETEGGDDVFYLGGLVKAAVLGRIAGESASQHCRNARIDETFA